MSISDDIRALAKQYLDDIICLRRTFHQYPELSLEEYHTTALIREELDSMGIPWRPAGETGTVATLPGTGGGYTVALRADIDALPVSEETGLPFASRVEGKMHACGHDSHTAMLLGAARILTSLTQRTNDVVLFFQPAEEHGAGALQLIETGALEGVDTVYGSHVMPDVPFGKIAVVDGPLMAGGDFFTVHVTGRGGHGSQPENCIDPIPAITAMVEAFHQIKSINMRGDTPLVLTVGSIRCGTALNVIPDSGEVGGTVRWFSRESQELANRRICEIAQHCAQMYGAEAEVSFSPISGCVVNDRHCAQQTREFLRELYGETAVLEHMPLAMSSEDFSYYGESVPTVFTWIGCCGEQNACGLHNPHFNLDESVMESGAALYALYAMNFHKERDNAKNGKVEAKT